MKKLFFAVLAAALMMPSFAQAGLIAGWDFQTAPGTAVAASPNTPKLYTANVGAGSLYLDGTNGSSDWFVPATGSTNTELNGFAGTALNAGGTTGLSTTTSGVAALALVNQNANGKHVVFSVNMSGFEDLAISYAVQRTSSGFTDQAWSFSTDATNWTAFQTVTGIQSSFALGTGTVTTLNTISGLDNVSTAFVRMTLTGASSGTGNNRIDNIQFNATAIPEPTAMLLVGMAVAGCVVRRRRNG